MKLNPKQLNLTKDLVMAGGRLVASGGTAASPSISFIGNANSGFYISSGNIALGVAGNLIATFSTAGITGNLLGNATSASTATKLTTARTIAASGDAAGTATAFDGSANVSIPLTLATVNSTPGAYGSATSVATFTVNAKGLVTLSGSAAIAFPVTSVNSKTGTVALSTSDVSEGTNLYFTTARARSAISATGSVTYNSTSGVITGPTLAPVATSGSYADLTGKPTLTQIFRKALTASDVTGATNSTLTINHNIGQQYVSVTVYDKNNKKVEPDEIIPTDANNVQINFTSFASDASGVSPTSTTIFNVVVVG